MHDCLILIISLFGQVKEDHARLAGQEAKQSAEKLQARTKYTSTWRKSWQKWRAARDALGYGTDHFNQNWGLAVSVRNKEIAKIDGEWKQASKKYADYQRSFQESE